MALAGHCAACGEDVELTPEGACPRGHGADQVSSVRDEPAAAAAPAEPSSGGLGPVPVPAAGAPPAPARKRRVWIIVLVVLLVALLGCCLVGGIVAAVVIPAVNASNAAADKARCFMAEESTEGAAQLFMKENGGKRPESFEALIAADYMVSPPYCRSGGTYTFDPARSTVTCSVHGHY